MSINSRVCSPTPTRLADIWSMVGLPSRGQSLYAVVNEGFEFSVYVRLVALLDVSEKALAQCLGISETTIRRRKRRGRLSAIESDKVFRTVKIFAAAVELFGGDRNAANVWMRSRVAGLDGKAPLEMLGTGVESNAVFDLIGRLEHGVFV